MTKKELALETVARLKKEYPDAGCTLEYEYAWKLLISVRLAAQCTDARVNQVVPGLYEKFPTISALADADESEIEEIVRPCGLGKSKARDYFDRYFYDLHNSSIEIIIVESSSNANSIEFETKLEDWKIILK